jgi:carboxyl-terminal processing protease
MIFRLAISLLLVLFFSQSTHAVAPSPSHKQKTLEIIDTLNDRHFVDLAIDDNLSSRFLENYIEQLDPEKVFFLSSDIQEFNKKQFELDDELKQGINKTGFDIYQRYQQRLSERIAKLVKQLEEEYTSPPAFTKDESIIVDDELAQWPTTEAMADDIWRKRVKSYFLNQKLTGEAFKESREKLIKRYKDQQKRINKNTAEDIYEVYINAFTGLYDPHTHCYGRPCG